MNQHAWCIAGSQARPPQSCDCRFKEIPCLKHWPETKIPRFTRFGSTVTFALARVAAGTDPRKICLLRGVIGSTTVSGTVSWGSSPYGVTLSVRVRAYQCDSQRKTLAFFMLTLQSGGSFALVRCLTVPLGVPLFPPPLVRNVRPSFAGSAVVPLSQNARSTKRPHGQGKFP